MNTLYVIATPIGNLEDITMRALRILKEVDFIICEDTRVTSKLLARYEIKKPLVSYFQHSRIHRVEEIVERLARGESAALVTDAGTPGISDPGGVLISQVVRQSGIPVKIVPIPGPCAAIAALSVSGLPADKFLFLGFPPHKKGRQKFWRRVVEAEETVVFYESPHRILKSLTELQSYLLSGGRRPESKDPSTSSGNKKESQLVVCRELTKMFESVYRGTIEEVIEKVTHDPVKGEYAVVVGR